MRLSIKLFLAVSFLFVGQLFLSLPAVEASYPEPPSQEQLDKWRQMGEENLRKYGSGESQPTSAPVKKIIPTQKPIVTSVPTMMPTSEPSTQPSPIITPELAIEDVTTQINPSEQVWQIWKNKVWNLLKNLFAFRSND